jgi:hypothetical protein
MRGAYRNARAPETHGQIEAISLAAAPVESSAATRERLAK